MGLLDNLLGGLAGGGGGSPLGGVLMNMLGGQSGSGQSGGGQFGGQMGGFGGGGQGGGGIGGLISQFEQAGLGHIAQSWVGSGPNQPVSPDQLQNVFGQERVQQMSNQAGMDQGSFLSQLSQHLPRMVDGMTPGGRMPDEGTASV